jgi:hypothetical protein
VRGADVRAIGDSRMAVAQARGVVIFRARIGALGEARRGTKRLGLILFMIRPLRIDVAALPLDRKQR